MGIRPARSFRDPDKVPWTRYSRRKQSKSYVKAVPHRHLTNFRMGNKDGEYNAVFHLVAQNTYYHRDNALEAARRMCNGFLEKKISGKYYFIINVYPHHIIRENKMVAGAGADRIQQGMRRAFGKPTHVAALINKGQKVFTIYSTKENEEVVRESLTRAARKLSGNFKIVKEVLHGWRRFNKYRYR